MKSQLPGRLGDPSMNLVDDPRLDWRIRNALKQLWDAPLSLEPIPGDSALDACLEYSSQYEAEVSSGLNQLFLQTMPDFSELESYLEMIEGGDGNEIKLFIDRPANIESPVPGVVHFHGGGMVMMTAANAFYQRWRRELASQGMVVIGVEFRNGAGEMGNHPFPAGLNDCAVAAQWVHTNKAELNISSMIVSGESGGANLSLATTLKAKQEGWLDKIDGIYALCPYIHGSYAEQPNELPSLVENDTYGLGQDFMMVLAKCYDPFEDNKLNPLAWPYHASVDELKGLPPHVISVNELDPLRDEGLEYYRKLSAAEVSVVGKTIAGTTHGTELVYPDVTPDIVADTLNSIYNFAAGL